MAAHLLDLNYETGAAVNIFHPHLQTTATIFFWEVGGRLRCSVDQSPDFSSQAIF